MKSKGITFRSFLKKAESSNDALLKDEAKNIVEHFRPTALPISRFAPATFLMDFSNQKYLYMEESCFNLLGYSAEYFLQNGLEASLSKWHPADFEIVNTNVWPDNLLFFQTVEKEQYSEYIMSYNFRMHNPKGEYVMLLQRSSFIAGSKEGLPAALIGVCFDVTHYKTDQSIIHTIERVIPTSTGLINELVFKKVHPVMDTISNDLLTTREKEILQLLSQGLSSKQIAEKINLSVNTINNHRKNMLAKTGCRSSSELTKFAITHSLIQ